MVLKHDRVIEEETWCDDVGSVNMHIDNNIFMYMH